MAILKTLFEGRLSDLSEGFIDIIVKNRRDVYLQDITLEFQNQYKAANNIVTAVVTNAEGLDADMKSAVLKLVKDSSKSEVDLIERKDKDLIGGLILRVDDKQYDGSIQRRLGDLRKEFGEKTYMAN